MCYDLWGGIRGSLLCLRLNLINDPASSASELKANKKEEPSPIGQSGNWISPQWQKQKADHGRLRSIFLHSRYQQRLIEFQQKDVYCSFQQLAQVRPFLAMNPAKMKTPFAHISLCSIVFSPPSALWTCPHAPLKLSLISVPISLDPLVQILMNKIIALTESPVSNQDCASL